MPSAPGERRDDLGICHERERDPVTVLVTTAWQYRCDGCQSVEVTEVGQGRPSGWSQRSGRPDDQHFCPSCTRDRDLIRRALGKGYTLRQTAPGLTQATDSHRGAEPTDDGYGTATATPSTPTRKDAR
jgi:hypothetical protein